MFERRRELRSFCTLGIGGAADYFYEAKSLEGLTKALSKARAEKIPTLVIGKGSNTLFDSRGFAGLVIYNNVQAIEFAPGSVFVAGGYAFARLGLVTARRDLSGLEFAAGIPGSVGGAVFMNAGAMGCDVAGALAECLWIDGEGRMQRSKREDLAFDYRYSPFQDSGGVIVGAKFRLEEDPTAKKRCQEMLQRRLATQPYGEKTAGCFFRNPGEKCAGALIDAAGLKGRRIGGAMVSPLHANFIVNAGGATSGDVLELIALIQEAVIARFGCSLHLEVSLIPYEINPYVSR